MSTWANTNKYAGQTPRVYDTAKTYDKLGSLYEGIQSTVWSNNNKNNSTFSNTAKSTASVWANQNKN
jgi:hypothetical protein